MATTQHTLTASDGLDLNVWAREPVDASEAVLFVHGIITNARALFDTPVEGDDSHSWLAGAAERGRAAFALDLRGYGESDRPPAMDEPAEAGDPPVRADEAAADIATAAEWVAERYDVVHLVGVSWGCHTTGRYFEVGDPPVASLLHAAPVYKPAYDISFGLDALSIPGYDRAWVEQDRATVRERSAHAPAVFDAMWRAQVGSNQGVDETTYVAQTGGIADWAASVDGDPVWDPGAIDVPTLVFLGSEDALADRQGTLEYVDGLTVDRAEYVEFAGVDHYMMHGERRRELYALTSAFQDRV
jgi:alpha-beta hydrolase superfamily lysophospholipase